MRHLSLHFVLIGLLALGGVQAAEDEPKKMTMKERMRARMVEDANKKQPAAAAPSAAKKSEAAAKSETAEKSAPASGKAIPSPGKDSTKTAAQPATVLPKVEVKKSRITVLDQQLAKQDEDIARERKNLKSSEIDNAFNDAKIARPLSIFGGESTQFRKGVAAERIELMEAEKDVMEAIAQARTKEEKAALQKQLDELKKMRRDLEKAMR